MVERFQRLPCELPHNNDQFKMFNVDAKKNSPSNLEVLGLSRLGSRSPDSRLTKKKDIAG